MLIEFRVKNYRCLRDEQVLSMVASKDSTLTDTNTIATGLAAVPKLLKSAAIYGPNAGGKSTLLNAMADMRSMILHSATSSQSDLPKCVPFMLDEESPNAPTDFEMSFIHEGVRYQYAFSCFKNHIVYEELQVYKTARPQLYFLREWDEAAGKDVYKFGPSLRGNKSVWAESTDRHTLFFSMAVRLKSEQLHAVSDYFDLLALALDLKNISFDLFKEQNAARRFVQSSCSLLRAADISISNIDIVEKEIPSPLSIGGRRKVKEFIFEHKNSDVTALFTEAEESTGTLNLLKMAPILKFLFADKSYFLSIDELNSSLHPSVVKLIVVMFHISEVNKSNSQLIFTTHDTSMLESVGTLFRRDQIWFVEKDKDQASSLHSLAEFSPRKGENIEKGYFQGRYGGLPMISDWRG